MDESVSVSNDASNLELVKENIQPIRQGRNLTALNTAISSESNRQLYEQRRIFETELRTYNGDDPLDIWHRYIKWVEQNFPKGGKEGNLNRIIERCISTVKDIPEYKNDIRFIEICLRYANITFTPLEIYNYMYTNNIGTQLAVFYESWAWELERLGNLKRADAVITEGINRKAQPVDKLQNVQRHFDLRMGKAVTENMELSSGLVSEDQRSALNNLKTIGKKQSVPVNRVGSLQVGPPHPYPLNSGQQQQKSKVPFKLCSDSNVTPVSLPVPSKENSFVPYTAADKENDFKPGKWTKAKLRQRNAGNVPFEAVSNYNKPFDVHVDEDIPEPLVTPRKLPEGLSVLSSKKEEFNPPIAIFEPPDPMKRPMYDKFKVYGGAEEFSFEEIRAAKWLAKHAKQKEEEQKKEQQKRSERIEQHLLLLQKQVKYLCEKYNPSESASESLQTCNISSESCTLQENRSLEYKSHQKVENCESGNIVRSKGSGDSFRLPPSQQIMQRTGSGDSAAPTSNQPKKNVDLLTVPQTEKLLAQPESSSSGNNSYNGGFTQFGCFPSTSVSEAMSMVREIYNEQSSLESRPDSFHYIKDTSTKDDGKPNSIISVFKDPTIPIPVVLPTHAEQVQNNGENQLPACLNTVDNGDLKENRPPSDYVQEKEKREMKGILVPSVLPFVPLECQEDDEIEIDPQLDGLNAQIENVTLAPLCNHAQFEANARSASTPFSISRGFPVKEDSVYTEKICSESEMHIPKTTSTNIMTQPNPQCQVASVVNFQNEENHLTRNEQLSVILENSRENYSKSSSSASSNSSCGQSTGLASYLHQTGHPAGLSSSYGHYSKIQHNSKLKLPIPVTETNHGRSQQPETSVTATALQKTSQEGDQINLSGPSKFAAKVNLDPFDPSVTTMLLNSLKRPVTSRHNYTKVNSELRIREGGVISFGDKKYHMLRYHSAGAYAKIFTAFEKINEYDTSNISKLKTTALKVCMSTNLWEFYISSELHQRLEVLAPMPDVKKSVIHMTAAAEFDNAVVLASEFFTYGSIVDVVNHYKKSGYNMPECLVMYFTIELLQIISKVHQCDIIHGDIKPDNFVLMNLIVGDLDLEDLFSKTRSLCLIDFGRAIDLRLFIPGTSFTVKVSTNGFQSPEMQDGLPWTFQTDWFGALATIHVMLFSEYMSIKKNCNGQWEITKQFKRYWQKDLWESLFHTLLNIPSCDEIPDITPFVQAFRNTLCEPSRYREFKTKVGQLSHVLSQH